MLGAKVVTCARDKAALEAAQVSWDAKGLQVKCIRADVADSQSAKELVKEVSEYFNGVQSELFILQFTINTETVRSLAYSASTRATKVLSMIGGRAPLIRLTRVACVYAGRLDLLFNNVGTNRRKQALECTQQDFTFLMDTNVHSALQLSQLCQPLLAAAGSSCIIFNSSVAGGPLAMKSGCIYAMTKGTGPSKEHTCWANAFLLTQESVQRTHA